MKSNNTRTYGAGAALLAWLFLHLLFMVNFPGAVQSTAKMLMPVLEVWTIMAVLCVSGSRQRPLTMPLYLPLLLIYWLFLLFHLADALVPSYFNRPFNLYLDIAYVPDLIHLLIHSFSMLQYLLYTGLAVVAALFFTVGLRLAFSSAQGAFRQKEVRKGFWLLTIIQTVLASLYLSGQWPAHWPPPVKAVTPRLIEELAFIGRIDQIKKQGKNAVAANKEPAYSAPLARLNSTDVHIFIIESYGYALFNDQRYQSHMAPHISAFDDALSAAGYAACSGVLDSPTLGGRSWLAFGSLESGVWLPDQLRYNFVLTSDVRPLADYFNQAGYRTVSVMPGTTKPWPEGKYFRYAKTYYAKDLNYKGPKFGWSPMPDQFVLDAIYRKELVGRERPPLFIRYVLTSSHASFHRQPKYLNDWSRIGNGAVFHRVPPKTYPINWPDLSNAGKAYMRSIRYDLTVLKKYLIHDLPQQALIIIMGDHQVNTQLVGHNAEHWVPIHVISRDRDLLAPFLKMGYTPGLYPKPGSPVPRMHTFRTDFLRAFSDP